MVSGSFACFRDSELRLIKNIQPCHLYFALRNGGGTVESSVRKISLCLMVPRSNFLEIKELIHYMNNRERKTTCPEHLLCMHQWPQVAMEHLVKLL